MKSWMRWLLAGLAVGCLGASASAQLIGGPQAPEIDWKQRLGESLPLDTTLTDSSGVELRLEDCLSERPAILALVYYECPMLCDLVLNGLVRCLRGLNFDAGTEFDVIVISIDHEETLEVARAQRDGYLERYGRTVPDASWRFLLGSQDSVRAVADAVGFEYLYMPSTDEYVHAAGLTLVTPEGKISRYFYGTEFAPRDLKFGLIEAADGAIGSPVDKVILRCFQYDPQRGKYGFAILSSIRFFGVLTVAAIFGFIIRMVLRERRATALRGRLALEEGA